MNKKQLEVLLQQLKAPEFPKPSLEQYTIPAGLGAEIINLAYLHGDIRDRTVFDFGCGSGRLSMGAAILSAKQVVGIDIDKAVIKAAKANLLLHETILGNPLPVSFAVCDINDWSSTCDTVIQNAPFGIQTLHADRLFLERALQCGKKVYSLHRGGLERTRQFLTNFIESCGGRVEQVKAFKFDLPYTFKFHKKPRISYSVDLFVIDKVE